MNEKQEIEFLRLINTAEDSLALAVLLSNSKNSCYLKQLTLLIV